MNILAIDPGTTHSGIVLMGAEPSQQILGIDHIENTELRSYLLACCVGTLEQWGNPGHVVCEDVRWCGKAGLDLLTTAKWVGRFQEVCEAMDLVFEAIAPQTVKAYVGGRANARDAEKRRALVDRFGGKEKAIGTKAAPGLLRGIKGHAWSALAVGVCYQMILKERELKHNG